MNNNFLKVMEVNKFSKINKINLNTKKILYYIFLSGGIAAASILAPKFPYELLKAYLKGKSFDKRKFNRDLSRLYNRGDISIGNDRITITKQGKTRVLKYEIDEMEIKKPEKWDGKWRLVVFDIPNPQRKSSNILRSKLNDLGFIQYQKSVFIFPYPCRDEIDFIRELFEVGGNVKLILATELDDEEYFLRKFHLKK